MSKKLLYILGAIAIVLILIVVFGRDKFGDRDIVKVAVEDIEQRDIIETVGTNGKIYPEKQVRLSVEIPGEVTKIHVQEGDSVQEGDLLLEINPSTSVTAVSRANATYKQTQANLESAKATSSQAEAQFIITQKEYNRQQQLLNSGVLSSSEFDQVESQYYTAIGQKESASQNVQASRYQVESALATLQEAQENLSKTKLYAPMSGIVSALNVEQGEKVVGTAQMAGTELITIADLDNMELQVEVGENDVLRISLGDTADIEVDAYLGEKFQGIVSHIAYSSNELLGQQVTKFQVKIKLISSSYKHLVNAEAGHSYPFRPGMSATADIITDKQSNIITVPIQSVTLRDNDSTKNTYQVVYLIEDDIAQEYIVETGVQDDSYIQILSGVEGGAVVSAPFKAISKELKDEQSVTVVSEEELFAD
ncbi:MAG: efflux RND transporter periplasmic adaptor subunit [Chitinophagales bacterium]